MDAELDERIKEIGTWCLTNGIAVIPLNPDGKKPLDGFRWGGYGHEILTEWSFPPGCNIAILTGSINNLAIVDCDTTESWLAWEERMDYTPLRVKSRRGMHYYYQLEEGAYVKSDSHIKLPGFPHDYDIKAGGSYCVFAKSLIKGWQYNIWPTKDNPQGKWMDIKSLPLFKPEWRPEREVKNWSEGTKIKDIRAYMAKVFANEGAGGDRDTFRLACVLADNEIPDADAVALMCEWNETNATPPWSVDQLRRKVAIAFNG